DKNIILQAKEYAKANKVSLSSLIENYLQKIVADHQMEAPKKGSIVSELSGIIKLDPDYDHKKDYTDYLNEKYK
ncbi:MAG: DUF6364 family protein, partial [Bacteroidota bacterium]